MKAQTLNLFIVDDNALIVNGLSSYLKERFGNGINISTFLSRKSAVAQITAKTHLVILDYMLGNENGIDILTSIKAINPKTEVIMLSSNTEMEVAVRSFRNGAKDYVIKGRNSWTKITSHVLHTITYPIRKLVQEFGISKYLVIFIGTFAIMGIGILFALKYIK